MNLIETKRLALRRLELHDASFILELLNQPTFIRHIGDKGVRSLADACNRPIHVFFRVRGARHLYNSDGEIPFRQRSSPFIPNAKKE